ncbi:ATP-binding cassette domain-containing protein [Gordonia sp. PP30]|uniref:ABC transporter ATP-binding protein n=1 Tax=Gordonia sp. PP30 TaxID=2935861 RepID=UPI002000060F|nr:ATP-binding cassette domain-containing protein [Gordonia sp. PP30]UQE73662.1 ATP-binding cassette domain-containing protein [Gordonia sp. PP30]
MAEGIRGAGIGVAFAGRTVLADIDCTVVPGAMTGILGPSGSGKTTLLRTLAGLQPISRGSLTYDGSPSPAPASIALLAQSPRQACNPRWTVREIIAEPARVARTPPPEIAEIAARVGLSTGLLDRYPGQLSDGQLQRACVARVLVQEPSYLLCDEPTAMLDPVATRAIIGLIDGLVDAGVGAALVSHDHRLVRARCASVLITS